MHHQKVTYFRGYGDVESGLAYFSVNINGLEMYSLCNIFVWHSNFIKNFIKLGESNQTTIYKIIKITNIACWVFLFIAICSSGEVGILKCKFLHMPQRNNSDISNVLWKFAVALGLDGISFTQFHPRLRCQKCRCQKFGFQINFKSWKILWNTDLYCHTLQVYQSHYQFKPEKVNLPGTEQNDRVL